MNALPVPASPSALAGEDIAARIAELAESARTWLAEANDLYEVTEVRARACAIGTYVRQRDAGDEAEQSAIELRIRAERRIGELLAEGRERGEIAPEGRPEKRSTRSTVSDIGLTKYESAAYGRLAAVPRPEFEASLADLRERGRLSRAAASSAHERDRREFHRAREESMTCPTCDGKGRVPRGPQR